MSDSDEIPKNPVVAQLEKANSQDEKKPNDGYQLENGLRIDGDGEDHMNFKLNARIIMALIGCSLAFAGSQLIPLSWFTLYSFISYEFGTNSFVWFKAASSLGQIAASLTLGPVSDLVGRRIMFIVGIACGMIGMIICGATPTSGGFIAGQAIAGFGLMTEELLAIAVCAELVPTNKRVIYGAGMIAGFIPWAPGVLYAQGIASVNWRWIGYMIAIWHAITLVIITVYYHPPARINSKGLTNKEMLDKIDFVGIFLSLSGFIILLIGINWGGSEYPWNSSQVIGTLTAGLLIIGLFVGWEWFFAKYPLFPRRMIQVPSTFWCIMFVIFTAGINYVPLAVFWPIQSISVFNTTHIETGINALPVGLCILGGAIISAIVCGRWMKHVRWIMTFFCVMQTAGVGGMVAIKQDNVNTAWAPMIIGLIGVGGVLFPNQIVATCITPDDLLATITSLTFTIRGVSQVISLSILSNRLTSNVTYHATQIVPIPALQAGVRSVPEIVALVRAMSGIPFKDYVPSVLPYLSDPARLETLRIALATAYNNSFPELYWIGFGFGVAACIASVLIGDMSKYMDEHVAVVMH